MRFKLIFFLFLCFLYSCHQSVDEATLLKYVADPDHGLMQEKKINGVTIRATYRPQDFLVKQQLGAITSPNADTIRKVREHYNKQLYFLLSLSIDEKEVLNSFAGDRTKFGEMVNNLSFGMSNHVHLVTSQRDTLELVDYIYPRLYGMGNSTDMLFAFRNQDLSQPESLKLTVFIPGLSTGEVTFKYKTAHINTVPKLKLQ